MSGELENVVRGFFAAVDALDVDRILNAMAADPQSVDEISRRWLRGNEVNDYLREMARSVTDVQTQVRDPEERNWGDVGAVTCWIEQDYTHNGKRVHCSAPTTIVLRREDGAWKLALFHSLPLPEPL